MFNQKYYQHFGSSIDLLDNILFDVKNRPVLKKGNFETTCQKQLYRKDMLQKTRQKFGFCFKKLIQLSKMSD